MPTYNLVAQQLPFGWLDANGSSFTYSTSTMPSDVLTITETDGTADDWLDDYSPSSHDGDSATQIAQADVFGFAIDGLAVQSAARMRLTGDDGSTIELYVVTTDSGVTGLEDNDNVFVTDAPLVEGVTYTKVSAGAFFGFPSDGEVEYADLVQVPPPDGYVDGTAGGDLINTSYAGDPDGDMVDNNDAVLPGHSGDDDYIRAGDGNDTILAEAGDDIVEAGDGDDLIEGGIGADAIDGGTGDDTATYANSTTGVNISLTGTTGTGGEATGDTLTNVENLTGSDFADTLEGEAGDNVLDGGLGNDTISGLAGNDTIIGGAGADTLFGNVGDDTISGGAGADTIDGGWDNDTLFGGAGSDTITGGSGNDTVSGGDGVDDVAGGQGNDAVYGGDGNDIVRGGKGDDLLEGGAGNDTFVYQTTDGGTDIITDFGSGESGPIDDGNQTNNDFVDLAAFYNASTVAAVNGSDADPDNDFANAIGMMRADQADGVLDGIIGGVDYTPQIGDIDLTIENGGSAVGAETLTHDNTNVVCFSRGTRIATQNGEVAIEDLAIGDKVMTVDRGYQPIRWIGSTTVSATGKRAPIVFAKGAIGNTAELRVSPNHRVLLTGWQAGMLFGENEVLVAAKHLVNDTSIQRCVGGTVDYFHMLFDQHEIILSEGARTESFHPGQQGWGALAEQTRAEILGLLPQLDPENFAAYGQSARLSLKASEGVMARDIGGFIQEVAALERQP